MAHDPASLAAVCEPVLDRRFAGWQALWLFGSYGTEYAGSGSDIDLALLLPPGRSADPVRWRECLQELEETLHSEVDLVDLRHAPMTFRNEILEAARPLAIRDAFAAGEFETLTISLWQKLNEERKGILADIQTSGRILNHG